MRTKEEIEFAGRIGMPIGAVKEVLDCIESRTAFQYIRKTLRSQYRVTMSNSQWAALKQWAKEHPLTAARTFTPWDMNSMLLLRRLPMGSQRYLRFPREGEEERIGGQSSCVDHRALSGQPVVRLKTNRISQGVIHVLSCCQSRWPPPPVSVPCGAGEREAFRRATAVANGTLLMADIPARIGLRLRRTSFAKNLARTLLWSLSAVMYPAFARSQLRGLSGARRHSVFCFAFRAPLGSRFLPKQVCNQRHETPRKLLSGPRRECSPSALGAGPTR